MRQAIGIVLACLLLASCSHGDDASRAEGGAGSPSTVTSVGLDLPADDPSQPRADAAGRTPDQVLLELIEAGNSQDWETAYSLYAAPECDFGIASREWTEADERHTDFTVREVRVIGPDQAIVRVTYKAVTTPPEGEPYPVVVAEPGEWWQLQKVDGLWKVNWLPRQ
jgi:hypothetical protein